MNGTRRKLSMPEVNMWWAQTRKPARAMAMLDRATHL